MAVDDLLERWRCVAGPDNYLLAGDLLGRWNEPHRRYHNIDHLRAVLNAVDELADAAHDVTAVRLAAWFHDAVHTGRPDDERASAQLAADTLPAAGAPPARVAEVVRLVELTATHDPLPSDANGAVLCDSDLAVLGSEPDGYAAYAAAVREEFAAVSDDAFRAGRADVLRRLLSREPLYATSAARVRWEPAARRNLNAELARLAEGA